MSVDKKFFLHDLTAVAIIKDEAPYLKEWIDYHLAAGVDHFALYDNESSDDTREVLKPYIQGHLVDYLSIPGPLAQMPAYNDAVRRFKFVSRYMAFLDIDEFIFPKTGQSIVEVVDDVLALEPKAVGLAINWQVFGSNNLETAELEKGVLNRFTRRAPSDWFEPVERDKLPVGNIHIKTIANPRFIRYIVNPHYAYYFGGKFAVNSNGERVTHWGNTPILVDKIVVNHYFTKSKEEFRKKLERGRTGVDAQNFADNTVNWEVFDKNNRNDEFDDGILTYRDQREENFSLPKKPAPQDYFKMLEEILLPANREDTPAEYFEDKLETFLTCRMLAGVLRRSLPNDNRGRLMEEAALRAIARTHFTKLTYADIMMMINALPVLLRLNNPLVEGIRQNCISFLQQIMTDYRRASRWELFVETGNYLDLLNAFDNRIAKPAGNVTAT